MKTTKTVLRLLAIVLTAFNLLALVVGFPAFRAEFLRLNDAAERTGYLLGSFLFVYLALFFFFLARRIDRRIRRKEAAAEVADFLS